MANLQDIDLSKLKKVEDIKGKIKEFLTNEEITELARTKIIPHYILRHPITGVETYCFYTGAVNEWFERNCLRYEECKYEQNLIFVKFDYEAHKVNHQDEVPAGLSKIKSLYKYPYKEQTCIPPSVYFLCEKGKVVYVGQSVNLLARLQTHFNEGLKKFTDVYFVPVQINQLAKFETSLINHFQPEYNIVKSAHPTALEIARGVVEILEM